MIKKDRSRINLGHRGEEIAVKYLKNKGYTIIKTNFSCPIGEIDIIAEANDVIALIEVRTKKGDFIDPLDTITSKKQNKLKKLARYYLENYAPDDDLRFDVIGITVKNGETLIEHIENAFDLI